MPWRNMAGQMLFHAGRDEEARREIERARTFPYETDIRDFLSAFRDPGEADKVLDVLESLGVDLAASTSPAETPS